VFLLAVFAYVCVFHGRYVDDAYITLSYARGLGRSGVWGMHPGFPSNAATSPLNILLLALPVRLGLSALEAQLVLSAALVAAIGCTLLRLSRALFAAEGWGYVATALLFANPLLISTSGLETYLVIALWLAGCLAFLREWFVLLGLASGLLMMARPDGALFAVVASAMLLWRWPRAWWRFLLPCAAVPAAWGLIAWRTLGSAIPDTFFLKLHERSWGDVGFANGLPLYFHVFPVAMGLSLILLPTAPMALLLTRRRAAWVSFCALTGGVAMLHFLVYCQLQVPPFHWYYGMECCAAVLLGSVALWELARERAALRPLVMGALVAMAVLGAAVSATVAVKTGQMPVETNWADTQQYREMAQWVNGRVQGRPFQLNGELGVIEYSSDSEGISNFTDRKILQEAAAQHAPGTLTRRLMDENMRYLKMPDAVAVAGTLTTECPVNRSYVKTWTVRSSWRQGMRWCWMDSSDGMTESRH
jgi:hypothetical protein